MAKSLTIRTSERSAFKRCQQKWWWAYVENLGPATTATPLWFGSIIHEALAQWYGPYGRGKKAGLTRGPHPAETAVKMMDQNRTMLAYKAEDPEGQEKERIKAHDLAVDMMTNYVDTYGTDPNWQVLLIEHKFQLIIPAKRGGVPVKYVGTFDGVARFLDTGEIWLLEHKTTAVQQEMYLMLDDQGSAYFSFAKHELVRMGLMKETDVFAGVMYNYMRKALRDTRPRDAEGYFTNKPQKAHFIAAFETEGIEFIGSTPLAKAKLEDMELAAKIIHLDVLGERSAQQGSNSPLLARVPLYKTKAEVRRGFQHIRDEAMYMDAIRNGRLPILKTPNKDCEWCPFFLLCSLDETGDKEEVRNFKESVLVKVDPYEVYGEFSGEED